MNDFSIHHLFADLEDPRQAHKVRHHLDDIVLLAIFAVMINAQSWTEIQAFGEAKQAWLKDYLTLENDIPSHDTIQRVFQILEPEGLIARFMQWTQSVMEVTEGRFIAIDGKTIPGVLLVIFNRLVSVFSWLATHFTR